LFPFFPYKPPINLMAFQKSLPPPPPPKTVTSFVDGPLHSTYSIFTEGFFLL
jgi:hypothetical protein